MCIKDYMKSKWISSLLTYLISFQHYVCDTTQLHYYGQITYHWLDVSHWTYPLPLPKLTFLLFVLFHLNSSFAASVITLICLPINAFLISCDSAFGAQKEGGHQSKVSLGSVPHGLLSKNAILFNHTNTKVYNIYIHWFGQSYFLEFFCFSIILSTSRSASRNC